MAWQFLLKWILVQALGRVYELVYYRYKKYDFSLYFWKWFLRKFSQKQ